MLFYTSHLKYIFSQSGDEYIYSYLERREKGREERGRERDYHECMRFLELIGT